MLYSILLQIHSVWRWVVLILLVWAIVSAFSKWRSGAAYTENDRKRGFFTATSTHIQLLLGLILYLMSPNVVFGAGTMKDPVLRFYTVEHILLMLIAVVLVSLGYSLVRKRKEDKAKFRTQFIFFLIGFIIILLSIPWPFREALGGAWI